MTDTLPEGFVVQPPAAPPSSLPPGFVVQQPSAIEDIARTAGPSLLRGGVAAGTAIPTLADLLASGVDWGANKLSNYLPSGVPEAIHTGAEGVHSGLAPVTYGGAMKRIEKATGPLYEAQTTPGKFAQSALEFLPSALIPVGGVGLGTRMAAALAGGVGSEGAAELAHKYAPAYEPEARIAGGLLGGVLGPKAVTPFPATAEHLANAKVLENAGVPLTAGAKTGSPFLLQREANLSGPKLAQREEAAFTKAAAGQAGMPDSPALTPQAFSKANQGFRDYENVVAKSEINPLNFSSLLSKLGQIRKDAFGPQGGLGATHIGNIDQVINDIKGGMNPASGNVPLSMPGGRYLLMRDHIQRLIDDASGPEAHYLGEIRGALDDAMGRSLPPGKLQDLHKQYANYQILSNAKLNPQTKTISPEGLHKAIAGSWGERAYNEGRGMSPLAQAGESVLQRPEPAKGGPLAKLVGAGSGLLFGKYGGGGGEASPVWGIFGHEAAPDLTRLLSRNPVTRGAYFNPLTQMYLKNQLLNSKAMSPAVAAKLLAGPSAANVLQYTPEGYPYYQAAPTQ